MIELYHACREINQVLPLAACGWLGYLTVVSWPAEWARPNHQWHYRGLLLFIIATVLLTSITAAYREAADAPASVISLLYTVQTLIVLALCWRWPKPARWNRDDRQA